MLRRVFFFLATIAGVAASAASCTASTSIDARPCPCKAGWVCCPGANMCVLGGTMCPPLDSGSAASPAASPDVSTPADGAPPDYTGWEPDAAPPTDATPHDALPDGYDPQYAQGILSNGASARCLTIDRDHVYWQNSDGRLWATAKSGGVTDILYPPPQVTSVTRCALVSDGTDVYMADDEANAVFRVHLTMPFGPTTWGFSGLTKFATLTTPSSLVFDDAWIYVTEYDAGRITKVPKPAASDAGVDAGDAGGAVVLVDGLLHPDAITLDGDTLVWIDRGSDPAHASADAAIKRMPKAGGAVVTVVDAQTGLDSLVATGSGTYWLDGTGLHAAPDDGGAAMPIVSSADARALVANASALFWISNASLERLPFGATTPAKLSPGMTGVTLLAVDDTKVFWSSGSLIRFAPNQ